MRPWYWPDQTGVGPVWEPSKGKSIAQWNGHQCTRVLEWACHKRVMQKYQFDLPEDIVEHFRRSRRDRGERQVPAGHMDEGPGGGNWDGTLFNEPDDVEDEPEDEGDDEGEGDEE